MRVIGQHLFYYSEVFYTTHDLVTHWKYNVTVVPSPNRLKYCMT